MTTTATEQSTDIAKRQRFIEALELPSIPESFRSLSLGTAEPEPGDDAGFVDDGSLMSFVKDLSLQARQDVLDSTLLASLAADAKWDRWKDTEDWYKFYVTVLANVGWDIQSFEFSEFDAHGSTFEIDKVVLEMLAAIASKSQIAVAVETMEAIKALDDKDDRVVLFLSSSTSLGNGSFQINTATEVNGAVAMTLAAFYFTSTQSSTRFLWFNYDSSTTHLFKAAQSATLDPDVYKKVRKSVSEKLGNNAKSFVANLNIKKP